MKNKTLSIMKQVFNQHCKSSCNCIKQNNDYYTRSWHIHQLEGVADGMCSTAIWCIEGFRGHVEFRRYTKERIKKLEIKWSCYSNYKKY